jgi:hypothetical protein
MIDKADVLFPEEGLRAGKSCRQRQNFPFLADGWRSDIDVIAVGGLRLSADPPEAEIVLARRMG